MKEGLLNCITSLSLATLKIISLKRNYVKRPAANRSSILIFLLARLNIKNIGNYSGYS